MSYGPCSICGGDIALVAERDALKSERDRLSADLWAIINHLSLKLQPLGSPPPGGGVTHAQWIIDATKAEVERLNVHKRMDKRLRDVLHKDNETLDADNMRLRGLLQEALEKMDVWGDETGPGAKEFRDKIRAVLVGKDPERKKA